MSLYQGLLGEQWNAVSPKVKNSHLSGTELLASCCLDVVGSASIVARVIRRIASLPAPERGAPVTLHIRKTPEGEFWERIFPGCNLRSVQSQSPDGFLVDRFGMIAFSFRLEVLNGGIVHHHKSTYLLFGGLRFRLPWCISPRVVSHEAPDATEYASRITVSVSMPLLGHVVTYSGIVKPITENA